jgi:hypothetical protein
MHGHMKLKLEDNIKCFLKKCVVMYELHQIQLGNNATVDC